ncbi:unnamed protein product [Rotaria socialis]|uniref:Uncharacterized protein n=1 Tax=Rotaria socialis TaxID=392032 RepID=A0A818EU53_9BILA|nr:unnamed protein product [Rotaria socialis]CAF3457728.1 unnamed protein product [Rotaria socialis]CAF3464372.1 unnamed protein product [Rotaria socialis]
MQFLKKLLSTTIIFTAKMDAAKADIEKIKEATKGIKDEDKAQIAQGPTINSSERVETAVKSGIATMKQDEHAHKAEQHKNKHNAKVE